MPVRSSARAVWVERVGEEAVRGGLLFQYTLRGLVQVTAEDMAAVSIANVVSDTGWDEGETDGE